MNENKGRTAKYHIELPEWFNAENYAYPEIGIRDGTEPDEDEKESVKPNKKGEFSNDNLIAKYDVMELVHFWYWQIRARTRLLKKIDNSKTKLEEVLADVSGAVKTSIHDLKKTKLPGTNRRNINDDDSDGVAVKELRVLDMLYLGEGLTRDEIWFMGDRSDAKARFLKGDENFSFRRSFFNKVNEVCNDEKVQRLAKSGYSGSWDRRYSDPAFFVADLNMDNTTLEAEFKALIKQLRADKLKDREVQIGKLEEKKHLLQWTLMRYDMLWDLTFWLKHTHPDKVYSGEFLLDTCLLSNEPTIHRLLGRALKVRVNPDEEKAVYELELDDNGNKKYELKDLGVAISETHVRKNLPDVFTDYTVSKLLEEYERLED